MDLDQVQVGHGGSDEQWGLRFAVGEPADQFGDQRRDVVGVWPGVDASAGVRLVDVDVSWTEAARPFAEVMAEHHEVQRVEQQVLPGELA
ncbi:hypothetical protein [Micromonospora sp. NPDC050276]|uniref:hypothetical protein n=1 Tax=Micromonospora sp. NPDC050276 TaxID=3364278 RepID=UPI0037A1DB23